MVTSQWIVKMNFWASAHAGMRGNMKRKIAWILLAAMTLSIAACGNKTGDPVADDGNITAEATEGELDTSANLEGSCADILDEIYKTAKTDDDYFSYTDDFENVEITEAEEEYILGTTEIDYTDSVYSAPMMSSIAYQCVLLRVSEDQDIEAAKKLLEENADPAKWICVEAESVVVENVGDVILFIMADKDVDQMLSLLAPLAVRFVTVTAHTPRAMPAEVLAEHIRAYGCRAEAAASIEAGVARAVELGGEGPVCALGTLYFSGDVRNAFAELVKG